MAAVGVWLDNAAAGQRLPEVDMTVPEIIEYWRYPITSFEVSSSKSSFVEKLIISIQFYNTHTKNNNRSNKKKR